MIEQMQTMAVEILNLKILQRYLLAFISLQGSLLCPITNNTLRYMECVGINLYGFHHPSVSKQVQILQS